MPQQRQRNLNHVGPYRPQVPGAEFGLGVRWRLVLTSTGVPERPLGIPPVVGFNLGRHSGVVPWGCPVAGQLSGTPLCTWLTHLTLCVPVLGSRGLSPSRSPACVFITAVPITKLFAGGRAGGGGHVLRETTSRGLCERVCPSHVPITKLFAGGLAVTIPYIYIAFFGVP